MMRGRRGSICIALLLSLPLFGPVLTAQGLEKLLPAGAKVIESADVSKIAGKPRDLVLWMIRPTEVKRDPSGYCGDIVYGDHWVGPTRLSLIDRQSRKVINTVEIVEPVIGRDPDDSFSLPFLVGDAYYHVPRMPSKNGGKPTILYMQDFTGDGAAAEFALFVYAACGIADTAVLGYDPKADRAVHYSVEVRTPDSDPEVKLWVGQIFATQASRPGLWDFTWNPGHGLEVTFHEHVTFDAKRRMFVDQQTVTPVH